MNTLGFTRLLLIAAGTIASWSSTNVAGNYVTVGSRVLTNAEFAVSDVHRELHKTKKMHIEHAEPEEEDEEEEEEEAPKKKHKKTTEETTTTPASNSTVPAPAPAPATNKTTTTTATETTPAAPAANPAPASNPAPAPAPVPAPAVHTNATQKVVNDTRIRGGKNEGVIDGSSEGTAEIDKIDVRNEGKWISVYDDPPMLVIKASLYAFISYNSTEVCEAFNMTLNAVEQKPDGNGTFAYHVVADINCTLNGLDETPGKFILNFIPEGRRLLLTECGHREEGEILNWLKIKSEVPECMTPKERKEFLVQPMKHIHATNGSTPYVAPKQTDFLSRLEELDGKEVAIAGSATVALIAVISVIVVFVMRKRKAQKDLERTIAGAKADHADEDEDSDKKEDEDDDDEDDKEKDKSEVEEGSFVNSPAVKV